MANDQRFPGSFRGIACLIEDIDDEFGQHTVVHEMPGRRHVARQNGPMPNRFACNIHFIGPTYQQDLDTFREALEQSTAGRLVHHWRGSFMVKPEGKISTKWSSSEGGMARLSVTFIEAGDDDQPSVRIETFDLVITEADIAVANMANMVADDFTVAGSNNLAERSTSILDDAFTLIADINNTIQSQFSASNSAGSSVANFGGQVTTLINTPHTMATTTARLIDTVFNTIVSVVDSVGEIDPLADANNVLGALLRGRRVLAAMGAFRSGSSFGDDYSAGNQNTPQQRQRTLNQQRMVQMVRIAFATTTCRTLAQIDVESSTQASDVYAQVSDGIDALLGDVDDNTYRALVNMRVALGAHLRVNAAQLPASVPYTPKGTLPSLLLAHMIYGDAKRADEIIERNGIAHPGFVPGGVALEILSA